MIPPDILNSYSSSTIVSGKYFSCQIGKTSSLFARAPRILLEGDAKYHYVCQILETDYCNVPLNSFR